MVVYVSMHAWLSARVHSWLYACMLCMDAYVSMHLWLSACLRMQSCLPVYSFIVVCVCLCMRAWVHFLTYAWLWECMYAHGCVGVSMQVAFNMSRMCVERKCNWFKKSQSANTRVAISFSFIIFLMYFILLSIFHVCTRFVRIACSLKCFTRLFKINLMIFTFIKQHPTLLF